MTRPTPLAVLLVLLAAAPCAASDPKAVPSVSDAGDSPLLEFVKKAREFSQLDAPRLTAAMSRADENIKTSRPERRVELMRAQLDQVNPAALEDAKDAKLPAPARRRILNGMAELNNSTGRWDDARGFADAQLAYDPNDRDAYIQRSQAHAGVKNYPAALADAESALELSPRSADALRARAMAQYGLGRFLEATEDARRALAIDPNDRTAFFIMKLAEGKVPALSVDKLRSQMVGEVQREYHGMVQHLNQAEQRGQEAPAGEPLSQAAQRLVRNAASKLALKDYEGAIADADRALAEDPSSPAAYYYRAAAGNLLGRYERAAEDATRALLLNPGDIASRDARAWAFNHLGRFRDAIADSHHSLELQPRNAYAFANLGYAHEQLGDLKGMLQHLKTAARLNPQFEPAYYDAAARHGLDAEPLTVSEPAPPELLRRQREASRRRQFLVVLGSSLFGGILIALGILHVAGPSPKGERKPQGSKVEAGYELGPVIGQGGMGVVYEAFDRALRRKVAVKVVRDELRSDAKAKARFLEEARTVAALHHPHIVDIHSVFEDEAGLYLVFERLDGRGLDAHLAERGRLPLDEAAGILRQVCAALEFAHERGIIHRDLKPANIMLARDGTVKVMDFGISRQALRSAPLSDAEAATAYGTPDYMAPEQEYGVVRAESDVFSLGACFYEMVAGRRPFAGPHCGSQKLSADYPRPSTLHPRLSAAVDAFVDAALRPDPDGRIRTVGEFAASLDRLASLPEAVRAG